MLQGLLAMYERCPVCGLTYKREEGYFIGAMYVSYGMAIPPSIITGKVKVPPSPSPQLLKVVSVYASFPPLPSTS